MLEKLKDLGLGFEAGTMGFLEDRETLVMIHGAAGRAQVWQAQTRLLDRYFNTLALDLPAHGGTPGPARAHVDEYAHWASEILHALFEKPVFLIGHSMGGAITQRTALLAPELIKGLVLASTGTRLKVAPMFLEGLLGNFEKTVDAIIKFAYAPGADKIMISRGTLLIKEAGPEVAHADFMACNEFDMRKDLERIRRPCLVLCGEQDGLTPPVLSEALHRAIRGSTLKILPNAGHMAMIEAPREFNQCVVDFVKETSARQRT